MKFDNLPKYKGGKASGFIPDGCGLSDDIKSAENPDNCYINIIRKTKKDEFLNYLKALTDAGFTATFSRDENAGMYREMTRENELIYLYYIPSEKTTRIIIDNASVTLGDFASDSAPASEKENLMQFGLYYSEMIKGTTCDCGMNYAVKLSNGEFIIVDGGESEQATEEACAEFIKRLQSQTGKKEITVAMWFCTHPHDDHMDFFSKLLRAYGDIITLKRVAFNFPAHSVNKMEACVSLMKERIKAHTPDVKFLKLHAGQRFTLSGTEIEVLITHEDILNPRKAEKYPGTNGTCTVLKITAAEFSFVLLADIPEENGDILIKRFSAEELSCTFLQAAHHCINRIKAVYKTVPAEYVLIPEKTEIILSRMLKNYKTIKKYHPEKNIFCAGDKTMLFERKNGKLGTESYPIVGGPYDGSMI